MEEQFILGAMRGGLVYGSLYEGPAVGIDVRSAYPAAMSGQLSLPLNAGEIKTLDELPEHPSVGIYRAIIRVPEPNNKLWRAESGPAFYTQLDIETAWLLGGTVELVQDGTANACVYTSGRVIGKQIFGEYFRKAYAAKVAAADHPVDGVRHAVKLVLNVLWGALCERSRETITVDLSSDTAVDIHDEIINAGEYRDGRLWFKVRPKNSAPFKGPYPRFAPFILARVRKEMATMLLPHVDNVRRVHTDGAVLSYDTLPADLASRVGGGLGDLKLEHQVNVSVKNSIRVKWA